MSIAEFSNIIKSQAYKDWFNRISTETILKTGVSELREAQQKAATTSFYITEDTIKEVISSLSGAQATPEQFNKVLQNLKGAFYNRRKAIETKGPTADSTSLYYPGISFDGINNILEKGFKEILDIARINNPSVNITDFLDRGHVFGLFPKKVEDIKTRLNNNTTMDAKGKALLVDILDTLYKDLEAQDLATSNLQDEKFSLYAKYKKKKNNFLVELQLRNDNQEAGRAQSPLSKALRKFFNPSISDFKFGKGSGEQAIKALIEGKGSPSVIDLIQQSLIDTLKGETIKDLTYSIPFTKINSSTIKVNKTDAKKKTKEDKANIKKLISSVKSVAPLRTTAGQFTSLVSLQNLLNQNLRSQIQQNMGTGERKDILNYRTGRFAESTKVERMSQSREGMITAFYSYMRNPYATFSTGGAQEFPATRDPKLLISKSIREIGATMVGNRMRAVLV